MLVICSLTVTLYELESAILLIEEKPEKIRVRGAVKRITFIQFGGGNRFVLTAPEFRRTSSGVDAGDSVSVFVKVFSLGGENAV
jgi:hypothetical protein